MLVASMKTPKPLRNEAHREYLAFQHEPKH